MLPMLGWAFRLNALMNGICTSETRAKRKVLQSLRWIGSMAVAAMPGFVGHGAEAVVCDGTNQWVGAASGGSWKEPSNWRAVSAKGYSVEELFRRYAVYDLRGLAAGAVLTNDYAGGNVYNLRDSTGQTFVCGLVASGEPGSVWTVVPGADAGAVRFCAPSTVDVTGGLIDFRTPLAGSSTYPVMTPTKTDSGAFRFGVPATYLWESVWTTAAGTSVHSTNYNLVAFKFAQANGGRLLVTPPGMSRVCRITAAAGSKADATAVVEIARDAGRRGRRPGRARPTGRRRRRRDCGRRDEGADGRGRVEQDVQEPEGGRRLRSGRTGEDRPRAAQ